MQAVILAGGLGTRMYPHTLTVPKAMLEVNGRPFVDWQLEALVARGFSSAVLCIAHLGEQIEAHVGPHVGQGSAAGINVRYSHEGPTLLGTAGALSAALPLLEPTFLVTYGDSYLPFDYAGPLRMLDAHDDCDAVMSVYKNGGRYDSSNVVLDGEWVARYVKGQRDPAIDHIDYGAIALRRSVVQRLPPAKAQGLEPLLGGLAEERRMRAFLVRERFFEIGSPQGLADLAAFLQKGSS